MTLGIYGQNEVPESPRLVTSLRGYMVTYDSENDYMVIRERDDVVMKNETGEFQFATLDDALEVVP